MRLDITYSTRLRRMSGHYVGKVLENTELFTYKRINFHHTQKAGGCLENQNHDTSL